MREGRVHIATDGREAVAICGTDDFLRLNGGSFAPRASFWRNVSRAAERGDIRLSGSLLKGYGSGVQEITAAEEEALHRAGYDSWELPEAVALSVERKAEALGMGAGEIMDIVISHRERDDSLCIRDIARGFRLAEEKRRA